MEKVVVVVVVMIRDGSLGSAERLDWENFREARLLHASSLRVSYLDHETTHFRLLNLDQSLDEHNGKTYVVKLLG